MFLDLGDTQISMATITYNRQTQTVAFSLTDPESNRPEEEMGNTSAISPLGWDEPGWIKHSVKGLRKWNLCDRTRATCKGQCFNSVWPVSAHGHSLCQLLPVQEEDARAILARAGTARTKMTLLT